ncbi:MAG: 30S ribosomal protein S17 [Planctomycetes bacterium]|nr:30S ribosomal protein S17 [Planctomycetota bacterium]MBL7007728.1 30S ribosomal protein S17 [Planctomycetota bacterium]
MNEQAPTQTDAAADRGTRKTMRGIVVSTKMEKTIVVRVEHVSRHPLYKKTLRVRRKFYAHDEAGAAQVGDQVEIMGARPLSKLKRWRLVRVLDATA